MNAPVASDPALKAVGIHGGHEPQVHALHDALGARVGPAAGTQCSGAGLDMKQPHTKRRGKQFEQRHRCQQQQQQQMLQRRQRRQRRTPSAQANWGTTAAAGASLAPVVGAQPLGQGQGEHAPCGLVAVHIAHIPAAPAGEPRAGRVVDLHS